VCQVMGGEMGSRSNKVKIMTIGTGKNSNKNERKERHFYAWKCEVADPRHRPNGRAQVEGCGKWQIKASKWKPEEAPHGLMVACKHGCVGNGGKGARKARLRASTRKFYTFESQEAAAMFCKALNEQEASE
jgi:hypothetical protein